MILHLSQYYLSFGNFNEGLKQDRLKIKSSSSSSHGARGNSRGNSPSWSSFWVSFEVEVQATFSTTTNRPPQENLKNHMSHVRCWKKFSCWHGPPFSGLLQFTATDWKEILIWSWFLSRVSYQAFWSSKALNRSPSIWSSRAGLSFPSLSSSPNVTSWRKIKNVKTETSSLSVNVLILVPSSDELHQ